MANDKIKGVDKGKDGGLGSDQDQDKKETRVERVNRELVEKSNVEKDAKKNAKKLKLEIKKSLLQELQATANNIKNEFMKIKEEKENQQKVIKENKIAKIAQKKFQIQLKENKIEKFVEKNQQEKNLNTGKRYGVIISEVNSSTYSDYYYMINTFQNDIKAVLFFRRQIRNDFLKLYSNVKCIVNCLSEKTSDNDVKFVCTFSEDRIGKQQRMLRFLHRDVFNDYNYQLSR